MCFGPIKIWTLCSRSLPTEIVMNRQPSSKTSSDNPLDSSSVDAPAGAPDGLVQIGAAKTHSTDAFKDDDPNQPVNANSSPQRLVQWGLERFADQPIVLTSSYGMEGCVLMDMCSKAIAAADLQPLTVACIDTGFFFPETKQVRKKLTQKYTNLNFISWETPVSVEEQREKYGDMLWKNNPNMCCNIRKVQPMRENIVNYRVWITALRRSQTKQRANTQVLSWDWRYQLMKFCPLASLSRADVWSYIQEHEVPFNQLHLQGYPSVSCFHCTKQIPGSSPDSEVRDGRWAGKGKTECGLHFSI